MAGLTEKQYDALRKQAIAQAKSRGGITEKQLDDYDGELFPGEREYLIRMNPPNARPFPRGLLFVVAIILGFLISMT